MPKRVKKVVVAELRADVSAIRGDVSKAVAMFSKAQRDIGRSVQGINNVFKVGLGAVTAVAAGKLTKGFVELAGRMAEAGDKANDIRSRFEALGGTADSIKKAQDALLGTVDAITLMQAANKGLLSGLPDFNRNFANLVDIAGRAAEALGMDTTEAINKMVASLQRGKTQGLKMLGFELGDAKGKIDIYNKAVSQIPAMLARLAPMTVSAGQAFSAMNIAIKDGSTQASMAVDNNEDLRKAFSDLTITISKINWAQVGDSIAGIASAMVQAANNALPPLIAGFNDLATAITLATNSTVTAKIINLGNEIESLEQKVSGKRRLNAPTIWSQLTGEDSGPNTMDSVTARLTQAKNELQELFKLYRGETTKLPKTIIPNVSSGISNEVKASIKKSVSDWKSIVADNTKEGFQQGMEKAIEAGDQAQFDKLQEQFKEFTKNGVLEGLKASIGQPGGPASLAEAEAAATKKAELAVSDWSNKLETANKQTADKLADDLKQAFQEAVGFWQGVWSEVIDTGTLDFSRIGKEIAGSFLANVSASLFGAPQGGGFGGIGAMFAQALMSGYGGGAGGGSGGGLGGYGSMAAGMGMGMATSSGMGLALAGTGTYAGGFAAGAMGTVGPVASGTAYSGMMAGSSAASGAMAAMPYLAIAAAIYMIGNKQGWWGNHKPQNDETKARDRVESYLENKLNRNFLFGDIHRFNEGKDGWNYYKGLNQETQGVYAGLGEGIKSLVGTTQDVGTQIGAILSENLGGSIDKAKMLFKELGVSADEMIQAVIDNGLKMHKTWLEIYTSIAQIRRLAAPGLDGKGDVAGAMQEITDSAAEGMDSILALKDMAIEGIEAGIKNLGQLSDKLRQTMPADQVNLIMQALKEAGITSMEQLRDASLETLISIIAKLQQLGYKFAEVAKEVDGTTASIQGMGEASDGINVGTDGNTHREIQLASGGVVFGPTSALIGDGGPEAVIPLTRRGGKLGIRGFDSGQSSSGTTIVINAQGAEVGVEKRIRQELVDLEDRLVGRTLYVVSQQAARGGAYGDMFGG